MSRPLRARQHAGRMPVSLRLGSIAPGTASRSRRGMRRRRRGAESPTAQGPGPRSCRRRRPRSTRLARRRHGDIRTSEISMVRTHAGPSGGGVLDLADPWRSPLVPCRGPRGREADGPRAPMGRAASVTARIGPRGPGQEMRRPPDMGIDDDAGPRPPASRPATWTRAPRLADGGAAPRGTSKEELRRFRPGPRTLGARSVPCPEMGTWRTAMRCVRMSTVRTTSASSG